MKIKKLIYLITLFTTITLVAQNDCSDAIVVCGNGGYSNLNATGPGIQEINNSNNICSKNLNSVGEHNSLWFRLNIKTGGTLGFILTPDSPSINIDFDFFIFGPNATCNNLGFAIRCSTTNPLAAAQGNNLTGMNSTETDISEGPGADGNSFIKQLNVRDGESYFLVIDRPIGSSNFDLTWTGTAKFSNPPKIDTTVLAGNTLDLKKCDDDGISDGKTTFDLTVNNAVIGTQPNVNITYHISNNDAILGVNPIINPTSFINTTNPRIFMRLSNILTECFTVAGFNLVTNQLPIVNNTADLKQCDDDIDGKTIFNLTQAQKNISRNYINEIFKFYTSKIDAENENNEITNTISYANTKPFTQTIWVKTSSPFGCFKISKLNLIALVAKNIPYGKTFYNCDDFLDANGNNTINNNDTDGITFFDISPAEKKLKEKFATQNSIQILFYETKNDRQFGTNKITNLSNYRNTNIPAITQQTIYVRIINTLDNSCKGISKFYIKTNPLPYFQVIYPQTICLNKIPFTLTVQNPKENYDYKWTDKDGGKISETKKVDIFNQGVFTVTATNVTTKCKRQRIITVNPFITPRITNNDITIIDDSDANSILINKKNLGIGNYEFALLDENGNVKKDYQENPLFNNLKGGVYTILIRNKNGCGYPSKLEVSILSFSKFFTPNGDLHNDYWTVKGLNTNLYKNWKVIIFDRYGKIITLINQKNNNEWDGTYKGKPLPSDNYWFKVKLIDKNGNVRRKTGHFSLIRN